MGQRDILIIPDRRLREISTPVDRIDAEVKTLVEDMFETMYAAPGIGLAAIQIGIPRRIVTVDVGNKEEGEKEPLALINPEIIAVSEELGIYDEGCLSIPDYFEDVERPASCVVRFSDVEGEIREIEADGLLATCVQHEIDHLNGVLFIDHISRLKRDRIVKKFEKAKRRAVA
jgi:peptide deformylase